MSASSASLDYQAPRKRGCTDVFCLIFFLVMLGGMGYIGFLGFVRGDPYRLLFGVDSWGNTCNRNNDAIFNSSLPAQNLKGKDNVYYFDFTNPATSVKICVESCPNDTLLTSAALTTYADVHGIKLCRYDVLPQDYSSDDNVCPSLVTPSRSLLNRCVPEAAIQAATSVLMGGVSGALNALHAQCETSGDFYHRASGDLERSWQELLILCGIAFGLAMVLTVLMRFLAVLIIWLLVFICAGAAAGGTGFCWYKWYVARTALYGLPEVDRAPEEIERLKWWLIYSCVATGVTVIVWLILLVMRSRIGLVAQLFKEAGRAIAAMPLLLFQPIWTLISLLGAMAGLLWMGLYILTSDHASVDTNTHFVTWTYDELLSYLRWVYLLGALWIIQIIFACHETVIAGAVTIWYFKRDKKKIGFPILKSIGRLLRYHLGSVIFGALLVALVQAVRIVLAYVEKKTRAASSPVVKFLFKCVQCCLWCFEKFIKFINRNAYIMMSIQGTNFCASARDAFFLLLRNVLRVAAVNTVGTFCLFLGKVGVTAVTVLVGMELFQLKEDLCYVWLPLSFAAIFAFFITHTFLSVYAMTIDTVLLSFCQDIEENDGMEKPFYMSKALMEYIKKTNQEAAKDKSDKERKKTLKATNEVEMEEIED